MKFMLRMKFNWKIKRFCGIIFLVNDYISRGKRRWKRSIPSGFVYMTKDCDQNNTVLPQFPGVFKGF